MIDATGEMASSCDCAKGRGRNLETTCIHIELVEAHGDDFGDPLRDGEEPTSFLISVERGTTMFSVAAMSGSLRHHSHKRTIVRKKTNSWKCMSCQKDSYVSHEVLLMLEIVNIFELLDNLKLKKSSTQRQVP
jgi:hypothetical protein